MLAGLVVLVLLPVVEAVVVEVAMLVLAMSTGPQEQRLDLVEQAVPAAQVEQAQRQRQFLELVRTVRPVALGLVVAVEEVEEVAAEVAEVLVPALQAVTAAQVQPADLAP